MGSGNEIQSLHVSLSSASWGCSGHLLERVSGSWEGEAGDSLGMAGGSDVAPSGWRSPSSPLPGPPGLQQHPPEPSMPWLCSPRMAYPLLPSEILTLASRPLLQPPSALSLHCLLSAAHLGSSLFSGLGNAVPPAWKALLLPLPTPFVQLKVSQTANVR